MCSYLLEHENNMICENARLIFYQEMVNKDKSHNSLLFVSTFLDFNGHCFLLCFS